MKYTKTIAGVIERELSRPGQMMKCLRRQLLQFDRKRGSIPAGLISEPIVGKTIENYLSAST